MSRTLVIKSSSPANKISYTCKTMLTTDPDGYYAPVDPDGWGLIKIGKLFLAVNVDGDGQRWIDDTQKPKDVCDKLFYQGPITITYP